MKNYLRIIGVIGLYVGAINVFAENVTEDTALNFKSILDGNGDYNYAFAAIIFLIIILALAKVYKLFILEKINAEKFYLKLKGYIRNNQYDEAIKVSSQFTGTTMGKMFTAGLKAFRDAEKAGFSAEERKQALQQASDEAGLQLIPKVEAYSQWFDTFAQVATLIGLMGTIHGLVDAFGGVSGGDMDPAESQTILTEGIQTAMMTTFAGLSIAVPTYFIKEIIKQRQETIVGKIDEYSVKLANQIELINKGK